MKRVIVTGAGGFVGSNLARRLLRDGHDVHLLVSPNGGQWRLNDLTGELRVYPVELSDDLAVGHTLAAIRPDWVFHLAAHGAYSWQTDLRRMVATNLIGTINLVESALRVGFEAFVNTGSSSEYGFKDHAPSEDEPVEPNSHYAITKVSGTHYCRYMAQSHGVPIVTLRLYSVYGPWEEPNRLIPTLIVRGLRGELPELVDAEIARDYVYVDDVIDAYLLAAQRSGSQAGSIFNVGSAVQTTVREVVALARQVLGIALEPSWGSMPNRSWDSHVWVADIRKVQANMGWSPRHSFAEGFGATVDWFRGHPVIEQYYRRFSS